MLVGVGVGVGVAGEGAGERAREWGKAAVNKIATFFQPRCFGQDVQKDDCKMIFIKKK